MSLLDYGINACHIHQESRKASSRMRIPGTAGTLQEERGEPWPHESILHLKNALSLKICLTRTKSLAKSRDALKSPLQPYPGKSGPDPFINKPEAWAQTITPAFFATDVPGHGSVPPAMQAAEADYAVPAKCATHSAAISVKKSVHSF